MIHPSAVVDSSARVSADAIVGAEVVIGPYAIIGPQVEIGQGTEIRSHAVIHKNCKIGENNLVHSHASIGDDPQDLRYKGQETWLQIGNNNIMREFCTVHRSAKENGVTLIGDHNFLMSYSHVAHDCVVANHVVFANGATLAGHVQVDDYAILAGGTVVHQFCFIGAHSLIGGASGVMQDTLPYTLVKGDPARPCAVNVIGLRRRGFSETAITFIRRAYRILFRSQLKLEEARLKLEQLIVQCPELQSWLGSIERSVRGIARPRIKS